MHRKATRLHRPCLPPPFHITSSSSGHDQAPSTQARASGGVRAALNLKRASTSATGRAFGKAEAKTMVAAALDAMAGTWWGRWLGLVTAVWVQCISGNNYTFPNYSHALKTLLLLLAIGSLEGLLGYGAQWMVVSRTVVSRTIARLPYWQMCVFLCLGGNNTTWMNTAMLVTYIRNFHQSRGPVSGLLKDCVGLSTAIFTDTCSTLFTDDPASFLVMLAVVPATVCALAMVFLREGLASGATAAAADNEDDGRCFAAINSLAVAIALYLLAADLTGLGGGGGVISAIFIAVLLVLLVGQKVGKAWEEGLRGTRKGEEFLKS
ncbi:protein NUCLEAR FUSION DEFECTIVE 4-like [Miscanthus floridulus]|uniref:protein NUCLEAR FUSION DEFECTIVE 4-like n=1 Tax=Miscanthus floridulus TaxID=154761 RepID=UPI00345833E7